MEFPRTALTVTGSSTVDLSVIDVGPTEAATPRGAVVCVHGAGGQAEQWRSQITYFSRHYRVVAPDLRGHGQSAKPGSAYSLEEFLWDFTQTLDLMRVNSPFVLLAHSFGGPIALTFAASQPHRISHLVLVATAPEMHLNLVIEAALKLPLPLRMLERLRPILAPRLHAPLFVIKRILAGTLFPWRGWSLLPTVRTPTLIVGGQFDFIVPTTVLHRMHNELPNSRLEVVRYARHLPQIERPEAVNRHIKSFIEGRRSWRGEAEEPKPGDLEARRTDL